MSKYKKRNIKHARQYDKDRYRERKSKGLCVVHGCNEIPNNRIYCPYHVEYYKRAHKRYINKLSKKLANLNRSLTSDTATTPVCSSTARRTF